MSSSHISDTNISLGSEAGIPKELYSNYNPWIDLVGSVIKPTWKKFYDSVMEKVNLLIPFVQKESSYTTCFQYFERAVTIANEHCLKVKEKELTIRCLDPLIKINDHMLEDTSDGILQWCNDSIKKAKKESIDSKEQEGKSEGPTLRSFAADETGSNFRKICFSRSEYATSRADIIVRRLTSVEQNKLKSSENIENDLSILTSYKNDGARIDYELPGYRTMPWSTVAFIEFKRLPENISNPDYSKQVCYYCESLLRVSPCRDIVFACLTNLKTCKFFAVKRNQDPKTLLVSFQYFHTLVIESNSLVHELTEFLITDSNSLGFKNDFPFDFAEPIDVLGRGSTACVILCRSLDLSAHFVMKISSNEIALSQEEFVLTYLSTNSNIANNIPKYDIHIQSLLNAKSLYGYRSFSNTFEICTDFTKDIIIQVWEILSQAHLMGIVHCDVRTPNIMLSNGVVYLIDWSSARSFPSTQIIQGYDAEKQQSATYIGASPGALNSLENDGKKAILYPADDAYSLIILTIEKRLGGIHKGISEILKIVCFTPTEFLSKRNNIFSIIREITESKSQQILGLFNQVVQSLEYINESRAKTFNLNELSDLVILTINIIFTIEQACSSK